MERWRRLFIMLNWERLLWMKAKREKLGSVLSFTFLSTGRFSTNTGAAFFRHLRPWNGTWCHWVLRRNRRIVPGKCLSGRPSKPAFSSNGKNRLVQPGVPARGPQPDPEGGSNSRGGGPGSDGGNGPSDPLIAALIQKLPTKGPWSADERVMWLQMVAMAFQMAYGQTEPIELKKAP